MVGGILDQDAEQNRSLAQDQAVFAPLAQLTSRQVGFLVLALLTALLVVGVRLYKLDTIQTDLYGDIQIVYVYVDGIRSGHWPFEYVLGVGPLYQYLITPLIMVIGLNFFSLKIGVVCVSLGILAATYALARRLMRDAYFALLAVTIAGVSSWLLIFSRLGLSLILVPLLVTVALWLIVRIAQKGRIADVIACALVSALGLYTYPAGMILPAVSLVTLLCLRWAGHKIAWGVLGRFVLVSVIGALPFVWMFFRNPDSFINGYIGSKFPVAGDALGAFIHNVVAAALAYHVRGDIIYRSNPASLPHLDAISGLLLLAGIVFWLLPARRRWAPVLLVPFVLLHLPSILTLGRPGESPSASRTLGVAPIVYILVASGLWWIGQSFTGLNWRRVGVALGAIILAIIIVLNLQRYFVTYIDGLPYHDTSIGGQIALYQASLPPQTQVYVVGALWEARMPELPFVKLRSNQPGNLFQLDPKTLTYDQLTTLQGPAVLVWSFHDALAAPQLASCAQWLPAQMYVSEKGWPVFYAAPLLTDRQ